MVSVDVKHHVYVYLEGFWRNLVFLLIQSVAWQVVPILCNSTSNVNSSRFIQLEQGTKSFRIMKILCKFKLKFQSYRLLLFCIPGLVILVLSVNLCTHSHIFSTNFLFLFLFFIFSLKLRTHWHNSTIFLFVQTAETDSTVSVLTLGSVTVFVCFLQS